MQNEKKYKDGEFTDKELEFIHDHAKTRSAKWIAARLRRKQTTIERKLADIRTQEILGSRELEEKDLRWELRGRKYWVELQKQFTESELELFEDFWIKYLSQFKQDILYSEESQLVDLIRYEILINRNLRDQKYAEETIERLDKILKKEYAKPESQQDVSIIDSLESQLAQAKASKGYRTKEHVELQAQKNKLFEALKARRDQRIKEIEDSKITIFGLLKMLDDKKYREAEARRTALFSYAADRERQRLYEYHQYADGTIDRPILNSESVRLDEDDEPRPQLQPTEEDGSITGSSEGQESY